MTPFVAVSCFIGYLLMSMQVTDPIELIPVDAGVEDRGALSDSLRVAPKDLRQNQSFERVYRVKGSDDIYIRQAGGLRAVFKNPEYVESTHGNIAIVSAGTVYCIGEVSPLLLKQMGMLMEPRLQEIVPPEVEEDGANILPTRPSPPRTKTIRFLDDETYRRQRLMSFVMEIVLSN